MNERKETLEALIGFEQPVEQIKTKLATFSWDSDVELVFLSGSHITNILNHFVAGRITASEVENWANAVEGRDDIGYESTKERMLRSCIHELANPDLTQPITSERAVKLLEFLTGK